MPAILHVPAPPIHSLAIETSGSAGSVAIGVDGHWLDEQRLDTTARHAADLIPAIDGLLQRHNWMPRDVAHCYVSIGPGSFTGLRVAVTFARHLALAAGTRLAAPATLDIIANGAAHLLPERGSLAVILDAKRGEVFGAGYVQRAAVVSANPASDALTALSSPQLMPVGELLATLPRPIVVTGEGIRHHAEAVEAADVIVAPQECWQPTAASVLQMGWQMALRGEFAMPHTLTPLYVRIPEPVEKWNAREAARQLSQAITSSNPHPDSHD